MLSLGELAPPFRLPDTAGRQVSLSDLKAPAVLVAFICNHCPFVLHLVDDFARMAQEYKPRGLEVVAISSNDTAEFPEDGPEFMAGFAKDHGFDFPYLYDETQEVALAYNAICTPDFFLFDQARRLYYAGQYDLSRPSIGKPPVPGLPALRTDLPVTGEDLRRAVDALLSGEPAPTPQRPSMGCSIKWRSDREPSWA